MLCTRSADVQRGRAVARSAVPGSRRATGALVSIVLVVVGAVACSDDDNGRRFANEPRPTLPPATATATLDSSSRPPPPWVEPGDAVADPLAADLLKARGAPKRIYLTAGGDLWTVPADGQQPLRVYAPAPGEAIVAVAIAPGVAANQAAILLSVEPGAGATPAASPVAVDDRGDDVADEGRALSLVILTADGDILRRVDGLDAVLGAAQPSEAGPDEFALSWSPQGDRLLVTLAPVGIVVVPRNGVPALLEIDGLREPVAAIWSPAGDTVAVIAVDEASGLNALSIAAVDGDGHVTEPTVVAPAPGATNGVASAAWLPDGSGLLYAEMESGDFGGDLYRVSRDGTDRTLVASAGRAAPVARVADFAVAPDGGAVAYAVAIPDPAGAGSLFHSLWVQSLDDDGSFRVPTGFGTSISRVWWVEGGLAWLVDDTGAAGGIVVERMDRAGEIGVLFAYAPSVATPGATPVASPVASPAASPLASPVGSPAATPVAEASPEASPV